MLVRSSCADRCVHSAVDRVLTIELASGTPADGLVPAVPISMKMEMHWAGLVSWATGDEMRSMPGPKIVSTSFHVRLAHSLPDCAHYISG